METKHKYWLKVLADTYKEIISQWKINRLRFFDQKSQKYEKNKEINQTNDK